MTPARSPRSSVPRVRECFTRKRERRHYYPFWEQCHLSSSGHFGPDFLIHTCWMLQRTRTWPDELKISSVVGRPEEDLSPGEMILDSSRIQARR